MYLFKTSGATFKSVVDNQKHAFKNEPQEWYKGEIILVSKNKKDLDKSIGEKQIQYVMKLKNIRPASEEEIENLWPGNKGRWNYLIECYDTCLLKNPFNLQDLLGKERIERYNATMTFIRLLEEDELVIKRFIKF